MCFLSEYLIKIARCKHSPIHYNYESVGFGSNVVILLCCNFLLAAFNGHHFISQQRETQVRCRSSMVGE